MCARSGRGVTVISMSKVKGVAVINVLIGDLVSHLYRCKVGPRCLSIISVNGKLDVSVISLFCSSALKIFRALKLKCVPLRKYGKYSKFRVLVE